MWEPEPGEPDEFARTDLRTGQPAAERSWRAVEYNPWRRLRAHFTPMRALIAGIALFLLVAMAATRLGYTQLLLDVARYRVQMLGVPALTETTIAPQPAAHLSMENWEKVPLPAPASQIKDFSADPTDPEGLLVCGHSSLEKSTIQGEMTPRGPVAIWLTHDAGKTWRRSQAPVISGTYCWISRALDAPQRLTALIERPSPVEPRCAEYDMLLSDDNGVTWRPTARTYVPIASEVYFCSHNALIVGERLFLYTNWSTGQADSDFHTSLARSDDGGRHWSVVGGDTAQYLNCRPKVLSDGSILTVRWPLQQEDPENTSALWTSQDRGDSWRPLWALQGIVPDQALTPYGAMSVNATTDHPL
jgi:hypothetical protein